MVGCGKILPNLLSDKPKEHGWQCGQYYDALGLVMYCEECLEKQNGINI